jgi:hypothetical protein
LQGEEIHVYLGIEKLAQAVNRPLSTMARNNSDYPQIQDFYYQSVRFFQLGKSCLKH